MPLPDIAVELVRDARALREFILLPWKIYRGDPHWVPPLIMDMEKLLDRARHPFHRHAEVEYFVARRGARGDGSASGAGEVVGRIAAIVNHAHNQFHEDRIGFYGFFEALSDPLVPPLLFQAAADWLREKGMECMRGPTSFSTNEECGLLVDGFDDRPRVMMTYNPPAYVRYHDEFGFRKAKDLVAYILLDNAVPDRLLRNAEKVDAMGKARVRKIDLKHFAEEVGRIRVIYNAAWEKNWGFVPMTEAEIEHMARELRPVLDPELVLFAEIDGQPVGFALALPDAFQALQKANGRLFPFGLLRMLLETRRIRLVRVLTLGVIQEFRGQGIDTLLYHGLYRAAQKRGYIGGEFSWVLEDNLRMRRALDLQGAKVYKTYRIYDYPLVP